MEKYFIFGEYGKNGLKGTILSLNRGLYRQLREQGIDCLHLYPGEIKKHIKFRFIDALPEPTEDQGVVSEINEGRIKIPKDMIEYAGLKSGKVTGTGLCNCLQIWNSDSLEKFVSYELTQNEILELKKIFGEERINVILSLLEAHSF